MNPSTVLDVAPRGHDLRAVAQLRPRGPPRRPRRGCEALGLRTRAQPRGPRRAPAGARRAARALPVQPLTSAGVRVVMAESGARRAQYAVQLACHSFVDAEGWAQAADHGGLQALGKLSLASDEWLDHLADRYGHKAVSELASVILQRAEAGPSAVAPFGLPLGLMLAR